VVPGRGLSLSRLSGRLRWLIPVAALSVTVSLLASAPLPAGATDPPLPAGASKTAPKQKTGSGVADPTASTADTQGRRGGAMVAAPTVPSEAVAPPVVPQSVSKVDPDPVPAGRGYQPGLSTEDVSARTSRTAVWVNPDGTRTTQIFQDTAFVPDGSGGMRPVDPTLARVPGRARMAPLAGADVTFAPVFRTADC
jgi:hypothetical protein